jgi:hypothetical protein
MFSVRYEVELNKLLDLEHNLIHHSQVAALRRMKIMIGLL